MLIDSQSNTKLVQGFAKIRAANSVPEADAGDETLIALAATVAIDPQTRRDATHINFVTLDPASSTDLDQAFAVDRAGDNIVLYYAIADIGAFVVRGGLIEAQAFARGVTVYSPDGSTPLYPRVLSSNRASLLPDGPRPAILLTVHIDPQGVSTLQNAQRACVRSRAKLAYETIKIDQLSADTLELARRIALAENNRGAFRVDRPEQQVVTDANVPAGIRLQFSPKLASEDKNAALSLATNLAVANYFIAKGIGLFRVMDEPGEREIKSLRAQAKALQIDWPSDQSLHQLVSQINHLDQVQSKSLKYAAFAMAIRRAGGGARYMQWPAPQVPSDVKNQNASQTLKPWHSAIAASYAHATAPMRRLADRYVLDLLVAQFANDTQTIESLKPVLVQLPAIMEAAERRAAKVDRECIDLIEATMLLPLIGTELLATVIDITPDNWKVEIQTPAVVWRIRATQGRQAQYGDEVRVKVIKDEVREVDLQLLDALIVSVQ
jgi:exoribonuclease R